VHQSVTAAVLLGVLCLLHFNCLQIANRIKAKGLNKLRWYCQLCQKSCRDENGFKCHQMSEGHQRQMQVGLRQQQQSHMFSNTSLTCYDSPGSSSSSTTTR
jgi:hypothetical protein